MKIKKSKYRITIKNFCNQKWLSEIDTNYQKKSEPIESTILQLIMSKHKNFSDLNPKANCFTIKFRK